MRCELCGEPADKLYEVEIEGARMRVCERCARNGKILREISEEKPMKTSEEELFSEKMIRSDYLQIISNAVKRMNLSADDISKAIGVEKQEIKQVLSGKIPPTDELAHKLEKFLNVKLFD